MSGPKPRPAGESVTRKGPVFVERGTYRRRRLMDAARLLPVLGALIFAVPLLWSGPGDSAHIAMSDAMLYVFIAWAVLITAAFLFGLRVRDWDAPAPQDRGQGRD